MSFDKYQDVEKSIPLNDDIDQITHRSIPIDDYNSSSSPKEKYEADDIDHGHVKETQVKRALKPRHVSMIALGGTIGTGLYVGIGTPLSYAGPVNALIAYLFMGSIVYLVTQSLGEMATFIPVTSAFTVFNARFLSPALGVANGYMYWFNWATTYAVEISVIGQVIEYWTDAVPLGAWIAISWFITTVANFFPVKVYGEVEFWVAFLKVVAIVGFILYAFIMVCGAGDMGPVGFRYWRNPGPWGPGILVDNVSTGRFLGWISSLINAAFTYQGTELVAISAGESKNPRRTVPKAINKVFFRILFFYILSLFFVGLLVPYNEPRLSSDESVIASSPFIIAIENSGTPVLNHLFNAVIVITVLSAANSNVYVGSRILYGLGIAGKAPKQFTYVTKQGVPYLGVICTSVMGFLAFMVLSDNANVGFNWLINISTIAGLFAWFFISLCHIRFMQCLRSRGISRDDLPFKAHFMPWGAYYASICIGIIILIQGYDSFFNFTATKFFTAYVSVILMFVLWIVCQLIYRGPLFLPLDQIDIDTDRREIDAIVWEDELPKNIWEKFWLAVA
ncbi:Lysine-specific permease [Wickerhamomyces ciferrii]|uniref:Lysine-specific permease n=1 Tax=Wickerhamomyces ciferrii (strain ATCC 14091 / BCRC 22168 / CBS 111 / JCM 3599 / NBRC 0793 / NRRL Y-1031 F-60-10) TaxID=1206466 RepID=K0KRA4_WICCF|nr:Lysine-specific permease [Wickerhamomyces ciferrii]CCH43789.1 Lysine-specific permease [Wickerhamomyces ciferrii]